MFHKIQLSLKCENCGTNFFSSLVTFTFDFFSCSPLFSVSSPSTLRLSVLPKNTTPNPQNVRQIFLLEVFICPIWWDLSCKVFRIKEQGAGVTKF